MAAQWKRVAIPPAAINPLILLKGTFFILADTPVANHRARCFNNNSGNGEH
jgi:hypothetical protein